MTGRKTTLMSALAATVILSSPQIAHSQPDGALPDNELIEKFIEQDDDGTQRFSVLLTYGDEKCPEPVDGEIIVCASFPENERYRIPEILRVSNLQVSTGGSWTSAVESLDALSSVNRPNSCSPNGSWGFTGCASAAIRSWFAERRSIREAEIEAKAKEEPGEGTDAVAE